MYVYIYTYTYIYIYIHIYKDTAGRTYLRTNFAHLCDSRVKNAGGAASDPLALCDELRDYIHIYTYICIIHISMYILGFNPTLCLFLMYPSDSQYELPHFV